MAKMIKNYYKGSQVKIGRGPATVSAVVTAIEPAKWNTAADMQRRLLATTLNSGQDVTEAIERASKFRPGYEYSFVIVAREKATPKVHTDVMAKARAAYAAQRARLKGTGAPMASKPAN